MILQNSLKIFTNTKTYDIIKVPNKLNIQSIGYVFLFRDIYTFFEHAFYCDEFDKMQVPYTVKSIV